jgi:myosin heavy subunit
MAPTPAQTLPIPTYRQQDLRLLESVTEWINQYQINEDISPTTPSPLSREAPLLPGLESPPRNDVVDLPTPATSTQPPVSAYDRESGPIMPLTKDVWESINNSNRSLMEEKRVLEAKLAIVERQYQNSINEDHDVGAQLGLLRYQNEANRDQKANMGRTLAQKEVEIKKQQLDIDESNHKIASLEAEVAACGRFKGEADLLRISMKSSEAAHTHAITTHAAVIRNLEAEITRLKSEQNHADDHATRAQNLAETLTAREKVILDLRQKHMEEKMRVADLEDKVESLEEKIRQEDIDVIKDKLREKTSACDRFRSQLKGTEQQLKLYQERLMIATNGGNNLRGAAHLVKPNLSSKLPKNVVSCSECYAKNLTCDSSACCRNCTESNNNKCARWRCSMKHKLGECTSVPCPLPHESQGWLVLNGPRPEW